VTHTVIISEQALDDLFEIYLWVLEEAGRDTADAYHARIEARLAALSDYPDRGTPQEHLIPGARSVSFERRIKIYYWVDGGAVEILRVLSNARDIAQLLN
jgi:toxin ParE1/3/4